MRAGPIGKHGKLPGGLNPRDSKRRVADIQLTLRRKSQAATKAAQCRYEPRDALCRNPVDLAGLPAGPKNSLPIEGEAFGMVDSGGENLEGLNGDLGAH